MIFLQKKKTKEKCIQVKMAKVENVFPGVFEREYNASRSANLMMRISLKISENTFAMFVYRLNIHFFVSFRSVSISYFAIAATRTPF